MMNAMTDTKECKPVGQLVRVLFTALEAAANGITITDRAGSILWVNPAFSRLTGYSGTEAIGQTPRLLKSPNQDPAAYRTLWETVLAGHVWHGELINRRKNGSEYIEEQTITPVPGPSGAITHFIGIKQDITERKRFQDQLAATVEARTRELQAINARLEEVSAHRSQFLASLSHELRTPLHALVGIGAALQEQTRDSLSAEQARYLNTIQRIGTHLLQLVNDILDLRRVEAGTFTLRPEPLALASILEEVLLIARGLAHPKAQTVEAEIEPDLPPLRADPTRFKQILLNLLSNAVKYTPEGGRITMTTRSVDRWSGESTAPPIPPEGPLLEISVRDTGIGIRAENLPRLFGEFVQLARGQGCAPQWTGIGLALAKCLVDQHGGWIQAESEGEGRGSTFKVILPLAAPVASPQGGPGRRTPILG